QTMTPEDFAGRFGARPEDANAVTRSLRKYGLRVEEVSLSGRSMRVTGTAAAMEAAFKPGLMLMHSAPQRQDRGRQGTLQIPAELKGIVTGVLALGARRRSGG